MGRHDRLSSPGVTCVIKRLRLWCCTRDVKLDSLSVLSTFNLLLDAEERIGRTRIEDQESKRTR